MRGWRARRALLPRPPAAVAVLAGAMLALAGCTKHTAVDACGLVPVTEAQKVDGTVSRAERMPSNTHDGNELCIFSDAAGERRLMVFYWPTAPAEVSTHVRSSMGASSGVSVVEVPGVGDGAAAGYRDGALKLLAGRNDRGMVGVRVRHPVAEGDPGVAEVASLVARALERLR